MKRVRLYAPVLTMLLIAAVSYGQSNTRGFSTDTAISTTPVKYSSGRGPKILLIPFYPTLCNSQIDKDVHAATHLDYSQITAVFRKELDLAIYRGLSGGYTPVSILQGRYKSDSVLNYIYGSTGYNYALIPGIAPDLGGTGSKNKKGLYVHKGELEVPVDYSKRFMNVTITNPHLLADLYKKYHTKTFVFINELDITNVKNPTQNLSDPTYRREITVHYSILNKNGKAIAEGVAKTFFPYRENDPKQIGKKYFSIIARSILRNYKQGITINNLSEQQRKQATQSTYTPNY